MKFFIFISILSTGITTLPIDEPKNLMNGNLFEGDIAGVRIIRSNVIILSFYHLIGIFFISKDTIQIVNFLFFIYYLMKVLIFNILNHNNISDCFLHCFL